MSYIFNSLIIVLTLIIFFWLFKRSKLYTLFLLPVFVQYIWIFCSLLIIENGTYINEQDRNGFFVYSGFYLFLYLGITILAFIFFHQIFTRVLNAHPLKTGLDILPKIKFYQFREPKILLFLASLILISGLINAFSSPSPLFDDALSKFNYWKTAKYPWMHAYLGNTIGYLPFILGLFYSKNKKWVMLLLVLYVLYLVFVGQKFTALLNGSILFIIASYLNRLYIEKRRGLMIKKRYVLFGGIFFFGVVWFRYSLDNPFQYLNLSPFESVIYRAFSLQAHLFWGTVEKYHYNSISHSNNLGELFYGMHILMKDFTPSFRQQYLPRLWEAGVSWTNGYPAILNRIFPLLPALCVHFFISSLLPFFSVLLGEFVKRKLFILSIIIVQLFLWVMVAYSMGYFYRLFKVYSILFTLLLFLTFFLYARDQIKNN